MSRPDRLFEWRSLTPREAPAGSAPARLRLLLGCFAAALAVIFARAAQLEVTQGPAFRQRAARPAEQVDALPAQRGRILARDGSVLAADEWVVGLEAHYRWIEDPPNPNWLRRQARSRLSAADRRRPERLAEAEAQTLAERDAWARRLTRMCGLTDDQWRRRVTRVQRRVEAIASRVNGAHEERLRRERLARGQLFPDSERGASADGADSADAGPDTPSTWWRRVAADLFALDAPSAPERMVVAEERAYHCIVDAVPEDSLAAIRAALAAEPFSGARLAEHVRRSYPAGELAANVIGHVTTPTAIADPASEAGSPADGSRAASGLGVAGIERAAEPTLHGRAGRRIYLANQRGQRVGVRSTVESISGDDVRLTLDPNLQRAAESLLDRALLARDGVLLARSRPDRRAPLGGAVVVMDVRSGDLLVAASAPRFDPNVFTHGDDESAAATLAAPGQPLFDRAARMALPPGSVFKIVTAIAMLDQGVATDDTPFTCHGYLLDRDSMRCALFRHTGVGHGDIRLADALAASCNTYFFHFAQRLGPAPLVAWAQRFGAASPTGSGLADEAAGRLATPGSLPRLAGRSWRAVDTQLLAVGQGFFSATPLQVARWMAAVANGGYLVAPRIKFQSGERMEGENANLSQDATANPLATANLSAPTPLVERLPVSPAVLASVREGLTRVVADPNGTGYVSVRLAWPTIAGKTGTAEVDDERGDHAWFAGYTPAEDPRWAIVVALEHGGSGALVAGPIARQMAQSLAETGYIPGR